MTYHATLRSAVCLSAVFSAGTALAEISAQQVWDDWQTELTMFGTTLSVGSEEQTGDMLIVRDVTLTTTDPDLTSVIAMGDLVFTETADGGVTIGMPDSYPMTFTGTDGVVVTVLISHPGLDIAVSGSPEALDYTVSGPSFAVALQDITDGDTVITADVQLVGNNLAGSYSTRLGEMRNMTYDLRFTTVDLLVDVIPPDAEGEYITGGGMITDIAVQAAITTPVETSIDTMDDPFTQGMAMTFGYTTGNSDFVFDINADGDQAAGALQFGAGSLSAQIDADRMSYVTRTEGLTAEITSAAAPFPIEASLGAYGLTFDVPVGESAQAMPFALGIDLVDLTLSDMIWSLIDPQAILPRTAATVQIGLSGLARPLFDLMDPAQQEAIMAADMPFELSELALTQLNVALAGATMTGEGRFVFDPSDMTSFAPLPRPEGRVSAQITGLNALLDNLVAMGVIPAEQLMAPRMMMGMFARATGDDQLETTLEVTPEGQVLANGQRIR